MQIFEAPLPKGTTLSATLAGAPVDTGGCCGRTRLSGMVREIPLAAPFTREDEERLLRLTRGLDIFGAADIRRCRELAEHFSGHSAESLQRHVVRLLGGSEASAGGALLDLPLVGGAEAPCVAEGNGGPLPVSGSPAFRLPAVMLPAVMLPAVGSPAVRLPSVGPPAIGSPVARLPAVESPVALSPAVKLPAVESPTVGSPTVRLPSIESPTRQRTSGSSSFSEEVLDFSSPATEDTDMLLDTTPFYPTGEWGGEVHVSRGKSPVRDLASPIKSSASPTKNLASPIKNTTSPTKDLASPIKNITSPTKDLASPIKNTTSPTKDLASPIKNITSPTKDLASPTKDLKSPTKDPTSPTKDGKGALKEAGPHSSPGATGMGPGPRLPLRDFEMEDGEGSSSRGESLASRAESVLPQDSVAKQQQTEAVQRRSPLKRAREEESTSSSEEESASSEESDLEESSLEESSLEESTSEESISEESTSKKEDVRGARPRAATGNVGPAFNRKLVHRITDELVRATEEPLAVVLYALYVHSGDVVAAFDYLMRGQEGAPGPLPWTWGEDQAIMQMDAGRIKHILAVRHESSLMARFDFLNSLNVYSPA